MNTDEPPSFGELLRGYRLAAQMTQEMLAERSGVPARGVADLERGVRQAPRAETVRRLADALSLAEIERARLQAAARRAQRGDESVATPAGSDLPTGMVTFLFTDVEGSTRLWLQDRGRMGAALARHDKLIEQLVAEHHGSVVRPRGEGDSRFAVFGRASDAVAAACAIQLGLVQEAWNLIEPLRVRMAVHTGEADLRLGDYYGPAVNHCARLRGAAYGGQVLVSTVTADLVREAFVAGVALRDLGEHQLRDLERPERIWQLVHPGLIVEFPPLSLVGPTRHNLPLQLTSFVGRVQELADIRGELAEARLLTLSGPGGVGKTRLALRVAELELDRNPDGVWLVELGQLQEPALVPQLVADVLGVRQSPGEALLATLIRTLRPLSVMLLLDNCEHVIEACTALVHDLVRNCAHVTILTTSREGLGINGESVWRVPPLSIPPDTGDRTTVEQIEQSEAAQLFFHRARAALPTFQPKSDDLLAIASVCRRLEGIPLALELAAARVPILSPKELDDRLEDALALVRAGNRTAPSRHQTLRTAFDWSYRLLTYPEQWLFARLSVFTGGWTLDAAEAVCQGGRVNTGAVLQLTMRLIEQSIVLADLQPDGSTRYRYLETLRLYAHERVEDSGELAGARNAHAAFFEGLAEECESLGPDNVEAHKRLEHEQRNLQAALSWLIESSDHDRARRLGGRLWWFWFTRGLLGEGRLWLDRLLSLPSSNSEVARLKLLHGAALMARSQADYEAANAAAQESLRLARDLGDHASMSFSFLLLGTIAGICGDYSASRSLHDQGISASRRAEVEPSATRTAYPPRYADYFEVLNLQSQAQASVWQRDYSTARVLSEDVLKRAKQGGYIRVYASALRVLAAVSYCTGDQAGAGIIIEEALRVCEGLSEKTEALRLRIIRASVLRDSGLVSEAAILLAACLDEAQKTGGQRNIAECLDGFACLAAASGQPERALRLAGAAEQVYNGLGTRQRWPIEQTGWELWMGPASQSLDAEVAAAQTIAGRFGAIDNAINEALTMVMLPQAASDTGRLIQ
jgi:predicted ATPase/class 3 adenylate cyclase